MMTTLREQLKDWQDFDTAEFIIGQHLGVFGDEYQTKHKGILWSANPLGDALAGVLFALVKEGFLEEDSSGTRFRWNEGAPSV